jgi:drug/metabolite transporter (DMT)-like permease
MVKPLQEGRCINECPANRRAGPSQSSVSTGLALMALAMLIIPSMDILGKLLSKEINGIQVAQWRFGFQALYILPFLLWLKGVSGLLPKRIGLNLLRAMLMAGAVTCFFTALRWMSVPDAIAVFFVEPLILTILSGLILKEQVGWRRRIAVGVGFIGALIVIQPSYSVFGPVSLLPVCTAFLFANYLLAHQERWPPTKTRSQCSSFPASQGLRYCRRYPGPVVRRA